MPALTAEACPDTKVVATTDPYARCSSTSKSSQSYGERRNRREIAEGLLVLLGVARDDTEADAIYLAEKIVGLRVFEDDQEKMNRSVQEIGGSILAVSQFTLYGDVRRGKRPSFDDAAPPEKARQLYEFFVEKIRSTGLRCETGRFQAMMKVELVNEGPVTILLDSKKNL
jgi:D-aminoacyl-tRNA deacylase